ncbi:MAG: RNA polymerase sigma-70 factor (ECF subfamily) [Planctomycetota bacterium]|jgi:RNA polymerase sigma-70 factor (ECF subfamily)
MPVTPLTMVPDSQNDKPAVDSVGKPGDFVPEAPTRKEATRVDHDLIRRAQKGDEAAFAALVERHQKRAWRVARNLVPRDEDADDIVQDAYMRVFRSLDKFNFDFGYTTWLFRIVTNLAIDHLRKRRPVGIGAAGDDDENGAPPDQEDLKVEQPEDALIRGEMAQKVRACIDALAPHFRSVMVLRELEGLPCAEIADIVGATHVTVRWRLHRGRKLFQDEWERRERDIERELLERKTNNADSSSVDRGEPT